MEGQTVGRMTGISMSYPNFVCGQKVVMAYLQQFLGNIRNLKENIGISGNVRNFWNTRHPAFLVMTDRFCTQTCSWLLFFGRTKRTAKTHPYYAVLSSLKSNRGNKNKQGDCVFLFCNFFCQSVFLLHKI